MRSRCPRVFSPTNWTPDRSEGGSAPASKASVAYRYESAPQWCTGPYNGHSACIQKVRCQKCCLRSAERYDASKAGARSPSRCKRAEHDAEPGSGYPCRTRRRSRSGGARQAGNGLRAVPRRRRPWQEERSRRRTDPGHLRERRDCRRSGSLTYLARSLATYPRTSFRKGHHPSTTTAPLTPRSASRPAGFGITIFLFPRHLTGNARQAPPFRAGKDSADATGV